MDKITEHRNAIDTIDKEIVAYLNDRFYHCIEIGKEKKKLGIPSVYDPQREEIIINNLSDRENYEGMIKAIWPYIMDFSKHLQEQD